jgi:hypothetical protein
MKTKKTLGGYMDDPDIINEPMALREIHAIRSVAVGKNEVIAFGMTRQEVAAAIDTFKNWF